MTDQGYFWISRLRAKTSYDVIHVFYQGAGVVDALVWLGQHRADRAAHADVEEVSLDLMIRWLPRFAQNGQDPVQQIAECGRFAKIIRPITRTQRDLPDLAPSDYLPAPGHLILTRVPRYAGRN